MTNRSNHGLIQKDNYSKKNKIIMLKLKKDKSNSSKVYVIFEKLKKQFNLIKL